MIYITGATGQLGKELALRLEARNYKFQTFDRQQWDICNSTQTDEILSSGDGGVVINCAAYTNVDRAESERDDAFRVNGAAVRDLARACMAKNCFLIQISSDFVFGSRLASAANEKIQIRPWQAEDETHPEGVYALSKQRSEQVIHEQCWDAKNKHYRGALIVRTSWVYSRFGHNFPKTILKLAQERDSLEIVEDQIGRPTWAGRLADFIILALENKGCLTASNPAQITGGICHFSNSGVASWYDFALATVQIAHELGLLKNRIPVRPVPTEAFPRPAPRPRFSAMDLTSGRALMPEIPHWRDDLRLFLEELRESEVNP